MKREVANKIKSLNREKEYYESLIKWSELFDILGIQYIYSYKMEKGSDFYLPEQKSFFVVLNDYYPSSSGVIPGITNNNPRKIDVDRLSRYTTVIAGEPDGRFKIYGKCEHDDSWLSMCKDCGKRFFLDSNGSFECRVCGAYDGDHHLDNTFYGNERLFEVLLRLRG